MEYSLQLFAHSRESFHIGIAQDMSTLERVWKSCSVAPPIRYLFHPFLPFLRLMLAYLTNPDSRLLPPVVTPSQSEYDVNLSLILKNS